MSTPNKMLAKDFALERQLGTGAFSKVMVGLYRPTNTLYAVKVVSKQTILNIPSEEERARMASVVRREAQMLRLCDHPNIVKFYASMQTPEDLLFITELCEGGELLSAIRHLGRVPLEATRHAMAELFSAVFYLHSGIKRVGVDNTGNTQRTILHRDIKPENVMLDKEYHIKLIDFGTAVECESKNDRPEAEQNEKGRAQTFCGTTPYMSPELLQDNFTCSASDLWGCGCVFYHMLTGRRPFNAPTPYLLMQAILNQEPYYDDDLDVTAVDLLKKLLIKSPDKRIKAEEVRNHPFFAPINFNTIRTYPLESLWKRQTPWCDEAEFELCMKCNRKFDTNLERCICYNCGQCFCCDCLTRVCVLPYYRLLSSVPTCEQCFSKIKTSVESEVSCLETNQEDCKKKQHVLYAGTHDRRERERKKKRREYEEHYLSTISYNASSSIKDEFDV